MYVSLKSKCYKKFAQEVWLSGQPVREMWLEGVKLYPDDRVKVKGIMLSHIDVEMIYWLHAVYMVKQGSSETQYLRMIFREKEYSLYTTYGDYPLLTPQSHLYFTFDENEGILLQDVLEGTTAEINALIPSHTGECFQSDANNTPSQVQSHTWELPLLPDTKIMIGWRKGQKKEHSYVNNVSVTGLDSGHVYADNLRQTATSEGRYDLDENFLTLQKTDIDAYGLSDTQWKGTLNGYGNGFGWTKGMRPVYPAFTKHWTAKIIGVTLQSLT